MNRKLYELFLLPVPVGKIVEFDHRSFVQTFSSNTFKYLRDLKFSPWRWLFWFLRMTRRVDWEAGTDVSNRRNASVFWVKHSKQSGVNCLIQKTVTALPRNTANSKVDSSYTARHDATQQNILVWFWYVWILVSSSPTADDTDDVVWIERNEYFACLCLSLHVVAISCERLLCTQHATTVQSWYRAASSLVVKIFNTTFLNYVWNPVWLETFKQFHLRIWPVQLYYYTRKRKNIKT